MDFPEWTPETDLKFMKKQGIDTAMMSVPKDVCFEGKKEFSLKLSRMMNDYMAEVKAKYPGKFGGFAAIPMIYENEAIEELRYALDELKLDGVCLMTNYGEAYLGDEKFDIFFNEMNERNVVLYIHPENPPEMLQPKYGLPNALIENRFQTSRMVANVLYNKATDKFPNIKYILSHGGGVIPYMGWHMASIKNFKDVEQKNKGPLLKLLFDLLVKGSPEEGLRDLRNMYYDTALTSGPWALNTLREFAGPSQIVFGSDYPIASLNTIVTKNLNKHPGFSKEDHEMIDYKNALELFPQFK